jgi:hypothetical protein
VNRINHTKHRADHCKSQGQSLDQGHAHEPNVHAWEGNAQ